MDDIKRLSAQIADLQNRVQKLEAMSQNNYALVAAKADTDAKIVAVKQDILQTVRKAIDTQIVPVINEMGGQIVTLEGNVSKFGAELTAAKEYYANDAEDAMAEYRAMVMGSMKGESREKRTITRGVETFFSS